MPKCVGILSFVLILAAVSVGSADAHCPAADLNRDCVVNLSDLQVLSDRWLSASAGSADLNGDDIVDLADFALLADQWYESGVPLAINEFMASNGSTIADPQGQYDDWIEIHNYGPEAIDIGGMCLTDDLSAADKWRIPDNNHALTTVAAGGYLMIWADGDTADPGLHASFKLDADGDEIGLFAADGRTPVDSIVFDQQTRDVSYGRYPDSGDSWRFFGTPTPAARNSGGYAGEVETPKFSHKRGFYRAAFSVTLATETEDAVIYYTLDGSEPYQWGGRFMTGSVYQGPISISRTTCLRAKAIRTGWKPSETETHTYIFLADVIRQSVTGAAPGLGWPAGSVNGQVIDYGMDPDVTTDARYKELTDDALLAVPTISVVTELTSLFDPATGIYVHADNDGRAWERPASVELINPGDSGGFQINAGLRIRGGFSRSNSNPKHAFRLFFRPEYGRAKLNFPLFEHEGADEFESVDLRTSQNYSWGFQNSSQNTMVREVFSRDVQGEMGHPYTRSRYYHLYINGQYWGLYQTQERSEASYAESYLGGDKDDYDAVKVDRSVGRAMLATDGNMDAYRRLYDGTKAVLGGRDRDAYYHVQGMDRDGTRNPQYERLLDVDNLIDFMIIEYYTGDRDGPGSRFGNIPNNTFSIYNRVNGDGWKFFHHDNEHTLGTTNSEVNMVTPFTSAGSQWRYFNPHWLHEQLMTANADYRMRFADRVYRHFFNGGLLTPAASQLRIEARARQIELAIIAESARWGDSKRSTPFTRDDHWRPEVNRILYDYLPPRTNVVLNQFKAVGWYPSVDPPVFNSLGGHFNNSYSLTMSVPTGTVYYTLDGSDPRSWDMLPDDGMDSVLVAEDADKRVLVPVRSPGESWKNPDGFSDTGWMRGSGSPGGVGYERGTGYESFISLNVETQMYARNTTCYIRIPFVFGGRLDDLNFMALNIRYDDGFIAYLNGVEIARRNFNGTPTWNSNASASNSDSAAVLLESIDVSAFLDALQPGGNLLAIQGLNASTTSADFLISAELRAGDNSAGAGGEIAPGAFEYNGPVTLTATRHVKASVLVGRGWSALNEAVFAVGPVAENLRITEIMYHPKARANIDEPNEEFVELKNIGAESINFNLVRFTDGIDFTFPNVELAPGEYVLVVQDLTAFEGRYGSNLNVAGQYSGSLNNAGERIRLEDAIGRTILDFSYKDTWRSLTDGEGFSLTIIDPANPDLNSWDEKDSWRASAYSTGSPGQDDSGIIPNPGSVVINEILAHAHAEASDWIELHNTTDKTIDIGGWFLSDSKDNLFKYRIAGGSTIDPYGYIVFHQDQQFGSTNDPGSYEPFALSENGEQVYLSSTHNGVLTGYRTVEDFAASVTGVSFGRYYKASTDNYNFVAMETATEGSANSYPKVGPVVISEIMYNPDWPTGGSYTNEQYEYIELHNISSDPVTLYDYAVSEPWKFTAGVEFTFLADEPVTIPAGGYILIVKKPEAFSWRYPDVAADKILGPYNGSLSNSGERLELSMPGDIDNQGNRYYIRIDRVDYSDGSHPEESAGSIDLWPIEADGYGQSLTRKVPTDYANDPENWTASTPTPGR